jgi:hypothetical protein
VILGEACLRQCVAEGRLERVSLRGVGPRSFARLGAYGLKDWIDGPAAVGGVASGVLWHPCPWRESERD